MKLINLIALSLFILPTFVACSHNATVESTIKEIKKLTKSKPNKTLSYTNKMTM